MIEKRIIIEIKKMNQFKVGDRVYVVFSKKVGYISKVSSSDQLGLFYNVVDENSNHLAGYYHCLDLNDFLLPAAEPASELTPEEWFEKNKK